MTVFLSKHQKSNCFGVLSGMYEKYSPKNDGRFAKKNLIKTFFSQISHQVFFNQKTRSNLKQEGK
jgi:hypothetical protein